MSGPPRTEVRRRREGPARKRRFPIRGVRYARSTSTYRICREASMVPCFGRNAAAVGVGKRERGGVPAFWRSPLLPAPFLLQRLLVLSNPCSRSGMRGGSGPGKTVRGIHRVRLRFDLLSGDGALGRFRPEGPGGGGRTRPPGNGADAAEGCGFRRHESLKREAAQREHESPVAVTPKNRRVVSPQWVQSSAGFSPRSRATASAVKAEKAVSLGLPRHGTGER